MHQHPTKNAIIRAGLQLGFAFLSCASLTAAPKISRLNPPSDLFSYGDPNPPIIPRFLPGQRFDLNARFSRTPVRRSLG